MHQVLKLLNSRRSFIYIYCYKTGLSSKYLVRAVGFRILPFRIVGILKHPQCNVVDHTAKYEDISQFGCFRVPTLRCGRFKRYYVFSLCWPNISISSYLFGLNKFEFETRDDDENPHTSIAQQSYTLPFNL